MADFFGIPARRLPLAVLMVLGLAGILSWLQGRFDQGDVKKAIALALSQRPSGGASVFEVLTARGEGDPACDGKVVSTLLGDIEVRCSTPGRPQTDYLFRVLLDQKQPPRAANEAAQGLVASILPGIARPRDAGP